MIASFRCKETEKIFRRQSSRRFSAIQRVALRKLLLVEAASSVNDLRVPPANRLEKLVGDRTGQWSIRVNDQFRICFEWRGHDAINVEIVDYH